LHATLAELCVDVCVCVTLTHTSTPALHTHTHTRTAIATKTVYSPLVKSIKIKRNQAKGGPQDWGKILQFKLIEMVIDFLV